MGKMHKMEVFVASYKVVCGGMETRAGQLIILFLCLVSVYPFTMYSFDIRKGNNVNENRSNSTVIMTTQQQQQQQQLHKSAALGKKCSDFV
jgi:hypothetical protein